ncbi:PEP-CTERM sorting domain-containing protein [Janthinobacterium sp.]|uniref:PEP-CTERM sorting domain-containing protein n=1 Tax=Janthinobacterium sp. TaxID=1871054 RepID=UPI00293D8782|nr:PEP-CTERM sorting domain-containing protein [Janthinobacterium sp.]
MKTKQCPRSGPAILAATLMLMSALAHADGGNGVHATAPKPAHQEKKSCLQNTATARDNGAGRTTDWRDAAGSTHLLKVLGNKEDGDIDGVSGPCRLVDGDIGVDEHLNDGLDVAQLLEEIDSLIGLDKAALTQEEEDELAAPKRHPLAPRLSDSGRALRVYRLAGADSEPDALFYRRAPRDWDYPAATRGAQLNPRGALSQRDNRAGDAPVPNLAAVPEPASYATLLAGMTLLAALGWRRRAAARRK